jgi:hypothetical protein
MSEYKTVIGNPARKDRYFKRESIREKIAESLYGDANILISAPRRIGKTSIIYNLYDQPLDGYYPIFIEVESISDSNTFFKEITRKIFDLDQIENFTGMTRKALKSAKEILSKIKKFNIDLKGEFSIEVKDEQQPDYYEEFTEILSAIDLDGLKILLLIDEFPVAVENISNKHGSDVAIEFLKLNRKLRQDHKTADKIQFVYTGSIGLYTIVKGLGATGEINDLYEIRIPQLNNEEATDLIYGLLHKYDPQKIEAEYLLEKIEWRIPFYIQLLTNEIKDILYENENMEGKELIDKAFEELIQHVNIYFDHFRTRLNKILQKNELDFAKKILAIISEEKGLDIKLIPDIAKEFDVQDSRMKIIEILKYDGYINNNDDKNVFRFNSPIMREWWLKNVA